MNPSLAEHGVDGRGVWGLPELPAMAGGTPCFPAARPLVFGSPTISKEEIAEVAACLSSGWIGPGARVERFEREFRLYKGAPYAIAVNSGTAAIQLALAGLGIGPGDEVIVPSLTFCPSLHSILHAGAVPVVTDCQRDTFTIDPNAIERRLTPRTRAILAVHLCGRCCDMDAILSIARRHRLRVIEDCAHAIEAGDRGRPAGLIGDAGCFSFYATKNLTTGDGGMVLTRDARLYRRMRLISQQGVTCGVWKRFVSGKPSYDVVALGFRCAMNDIAASLGVAQLASLEERWRDRERLWEAYNRNLRGLPLTLPPPVDPGSRHSFHLYTPLLGDGAAISRDDLIRALEAENIRISVHYIPTHQQPFYRRRFGLRRADFPNATFVGERTFSLPLSAAMTADDVSLVCRALRRILLYSSGRNAQDNWPGASGRFAVPCSAAEKTF